MQQESKLHKIGPLVEGEGERGHVFQLDEMKMEGVGTIVWIFLVVSLLHVVSGSTAYSALCDSVFCSVLSEANAEINKLKGTNMIDCCLHYLLSSSSEVILLPSIHSINSRLLYLRSNKWRFMCSKVWGWSWSNLQHCIGKFYNKGTTWWQ